MTCTRSPCLLGYGADAVCPRLALETVAGMADADELGELDAVEAQAKLQAALEDGVLKIMSKMGISTLDGYRGAQIFEALGLAPRWSTSACRGTPSAVGGIGYGRAGRATARRGTRAPRGETPALDEPGLVRFRKRGGEYHASNPDVFEALHAVVGSRGEVAERPRAAGRARAPGRDPDGRAELYDRFAALVDARPPTELHDLLELVPRPAGAARRGRAGHRRSSAASRPAR